MREALVNHANNFHNRTMNAEASTVIEALSNVAAKFSWTLRGEPEHDTLKISILRNSDRSVIADILVEPLHKQGECYRCTRWHRILYRFHADKGPSSEIREGIIDLMESLARLLDQHGPLHLPSTVRNGRDELPVLEIGNGRYTEYILRVDFHCNQRCPFCFVSTSNHRLSIAQIEQTLSRIKNKTDSIVVLSGGEPTLHPDLLSVIHRIYELGFPNISIQTNAVKLADDHLAEQVIMAGVKSFVVSFQSHIPEVYDQLTGTRNMFERACRGIRNLRALGACVDQNVIMNRLNITTLDSYISFSLEKLYGGPRKGAIFFTLMNGTGHEKARDLAISLDEIRSPLARAVEICRSNGLAVAPFFGECAPPPCVIDHPEITHTNSAPSNITYCDGTNLPENGRVKSYHCRECVFDYICFGVPVEYARLFGLEGLRPVFQTKGH